MNIMDGVVAAITAIIGVLVYNSVNSTANLTGNEATLFNLVPLIIAAAVILALLKWS